MKYQVTKISHQLFDSRRVSIFTLSSGHVAHVWSNGVVTVCNKNGNYSSQLISIKVMNAIREFRFASLEA